MATDTISKSGSSLTVKVISVGLLGAAIYFVFFHNGGVFSKKTEPNVAYEPGQNIDMSVYEGRKKYYGQGDDSNYIQGFDMPGNIDDINWKVADKISVITKPDSPMVFKTVAPASMINIWRINDSQVAYAKNSTSAIETENYDGIKKFIVLAKNTALKNKS